jgi:hypothetical protein
MGSASTMEQQRHGRAARTRGIHAWHFAEHVADSEWGKVERQFGPDTGRIWTQAKNKVYSPWTALHFLFKGQSH